MAKSVTTTDFQRHCLRDCFIGSSFRLQAEETLYCTIESIAKRPATMAPPWSPAPLGLNPNAAIPILPSGPWTLPEPWTCPPLSASCP
jgi:hypothetical protein